MGERGGGRLEMKHSTVTLTGLCVALVLLVRQTKETGKFSRKESQNETIPFLEKIIFFDSHHSHQKLLVC